MADDTTLLEIGFDNNKLLSQIKDVVSKLNSFFSTISNNNLKQELNNLKIKNNEEFNSIKNSAIEKQKLNKTLLNDTINNIKKEYIEKKSQISKINEEEKQQLKNKQNDIKEFYNHIFSDLIKQQKDAVNNITNELNNKIGNIKKTIDSNIAIIKQSINELNSFYNTEIKRIDNIKNTKTNNIKEEFRLKLSNLEDEHKKELEKLNNKKQTLDIEFKQKLDNLKKLEKREIDNEIRLTNQHLDNFNKTQDKIFNKKISDLNKEYDLKIKNIKKEEEEEIKSLSKKISEKEKKLSSLKIDSSITKTKTDIDNLKKQLDEVVSSYKSKLEEINKIKNENTNKLLQQLKQTKDVEFSFNKSKLEENILSITNKYKSEIDDINHKYKQQLSYIQSEKEQTNKNIKSKKDQLEELHKKEIDFINKKHSQELANLEKEKKEKLYLLEQNIKHNKELYNTKKRELEQLYDKEKQIAQEYYKFKTQSKQRELEEELNKIDRELIKNKNLYNTKKQELKELHKLELNNQKQIYNEKINNINSEKIKAIEEINAKKQAELNNLREINNAKKQAYDVLSYIPNKISENISYLFNNLFKRIKQEFDSINRYIISETKKSFEKGFEDFKFSDIYIKSIQSMRDISGQAKDVLAGSSLPFLSYPKVVKDMTDIANKYGVTISTVSQYTQKAVESGLDYEKALIVVDNAIMGSIASHSKLDDVLNGLLRSIYIYGDANKGYSDMVDRSSKSLNMFMIAAARGSLSLGDFSKQLGNIAPQAKRLGIDLPELAVMFSGMAQRMRNSPEAGTALLNVFNKLSKPIQGARDAIKKINEELTKLGKPTIDIGKLGVEKEGGGIKLLLRLKEVMFMLDKKQQELFKNLLFNEIRAAKGFESLIDVLDILLEEQELLIKNTDHLNKAYATMADSIDFKINTIKNRIINNFEILYFNNRNLVNSIIDSIANYIDKYISYIYNFINSILNNEKLFSVVLKTIQNFEVAFILAWRSILMFINAFNAIFGTGGSMSTFTNDIGTGFLRLMNNISAIILSLSSAFYGYARAVAYVSQVIGVLINWLVNLGRIILSNDKLITALATVAIGATLIGALYKLYTFIETVIKGFGAFGFVVGGLVPILGTLAGLLIAIATGFINLSHIVDTYSNFKEDMQKITDEMKQKKDIQNNFNQLLKEEEQIKKRIVGLKVKKDKTEQDKKDIKTEENNLKRLQNRIENFKKQAEKINIPVIDLKPVDLNNIQKQSKDIVDSWLTKIQDTTSTNELNLDLTKKDKRNKDKQNLKNRLDEIEDVYRNHIENTDGLFKSGKIDEYEKQRLLKIAEAFRIVSLMLLKEGKEFTDGYAKVIKQIQTDDLSFLDNNQINKIKKGFSTLAIANKDELNNLSKQREEINKRIEQSNTNVIENITTFNWNNYVRNTEKQSNEIRKNNEEFLILNNEHLEQYSKDTINRLENLESLKAIFNEQSFKNRTNEIENENNKLQELQKTLLQNLLNTQIEFNKKKEEEELNSFKRQYDSGLLNQEQYEFGILEIRKKYLKQRENLVTNLTKNIDRNKTISKSIRNILPIKDINEFKKQFLDVSKEISNNQLDIEISKNNRIKEHYIQSLNEQLNSDNIIFDKRKEILNELLELNKNNIDKQLEFIKSYTNSSINELNTLSNFITNSLKTISSIFQNNDNELQKQINSIFNIDNSNLDNTINLLSDISQMSIKINELSNKRNILQDKLNSSLDKTSEEYKKINQEIENTNNLLNSIASGNLLSIVSSLFTIIIADLKKTIDTANKYATNSFLDMLITIQNTITSVLIAPFEAIANLFGSTLKVKYIKQFEEASQLIKDKITEHFKILNNLIIDSLKKISEEYYKILDNLTNKQKEYDNLKVESYYKEKRLIDDLLKSRIDSHKERLRQIKKEKEDEEKAIKAVRELREQRFEDKQKKANAQKRLNEELKSRQFGEDFYRQTTEEFKTKIELEEQNIKNRYEVLGEIDFETYQSMMRDLSVKKASYWRRRIQNISSPDDPESAKIAKDKSDLEIRRKALEQAKLIAQINKDNIKVDELNKEIEKIANQIINLDQVLGNNKSLKFRMEATKEFNEAQKQFLDNYYDTDMENAIKQDNIHKDRISALETEEKTITKSLENYQDAYDKATKQLFDDYNDGSDKWYNNMKTRMNSLLDISKQLNSEFGLTALQGLSEINNKNVRNMEVVYDKLREFYRGIVQDTDETQKNIENIITDLNIATNKIIDIRKIGSSIVPEYYTQQTTKASTLQGDITQSKSVAKEYQKQYGKELSTQHYPEIQNKIDQDKQMMLDRLRKANLITEEQKNLGVRNTVKVKAVDYLINKYGVNFDKAVNIVNKTKLDTSQRDLYTSDTKELDYYIQQENSKQQSIKQSNIVNDIISSANKMTSILRNAIPNAKFSKGGVIDKPTIALMGESGSETVFNARQMRNLFNMINNNQIPNNSTVNNVNISINSPVIRNDSDINKIADIVSQKLTKQLVRQI